MNDFVEEEERERKKGVRKRGCSEVSSCRERARTDQVKARQRFFAKEARESMAEARETISLMTTSWKNGNDGAWFRKTGFQAKQTNGLRARGPRGLEFRSGPAPERLPSAMK